MSSALASRGNAVISITGVDYSGKEGYLVKSASGTHALNDSKTVPAKFVVLDGNTSTKDTSVMPLGGGEVVKLKLGGTVKKGDTLEQKNDGTVVVDENASTARVVIGIALEDGVSGDLIDAITCTPIIQP